MPIIPALLFIAVPVIAALSLEIDAFAAVLILLCVVAGLSVGTGAQPVRATEDGEARAPDLQKEHAPRRRSTKPVRADLHSAASRRISRF